MLASGHGGGHDLHLRTLRAAGVTLTGRFLGAEDGEARFASDLCASVAWGDERQAQLGGLVRALAAERGIDHGLTEPEPFEGEGPERIEPATLRTVLFATGFRPDYASWLPWPEAFDELGFPLHEDGESTAVPGLHFVGVHFLRKRKSSLFLGVGEDAADRRARIAAGLSWGLLGVDYTPR